MSLLTAIERLRHQVASSRDREREGHLPARRQWAEMLLLFAIRRLGPGYYDSARLWRRGIPLRAKLRHVNERAYVQLIDRVNHPDYRKLSQHKVAEKAMLTLFGIATPRFLGHLHVANGCTRDGHPLRNAGELLELLRAHRPGRICFKRVEGWGGLGFEAAEVRYSVDPPQLRPLNNTAWMEAESYLRDRLRVADDSAGRIVEEYLQQHPWLESLNPTSVNTVRLYAIVDDEGPVRLLGAILRIGRGGSLVDNVSGGGIYCPVDMATGTLASARSDLSPELHDRHPDSAVQISGEVLPFWNEALALVERVARLFPRTRFAGLDIAITPEGPALIELNVQPDRAAVWDVDMPTIDMLTPRPPAASPATPAPTATPVGDSGGL